MSTSSLPWTQRPRPGYIQSTERIIPETNVKTRKATAKNQNSVGSTEATTFTQEELAESPNVIPTEYLKQNQSVARFIPQMGDESQTAVSIRGFGDNAAANSLILVDGFPLINPSLLVPNLNSIILSDIDRIEIIEGSRGSRFGDQAVGGIVNIITIHPKKQFSNINLKVASNALTSGTFIYGNRFLNDVYVKTFALASKTNNYRHHNQQKDGNILATIGRDYESGTFSINLQTYSDHIENPGGLTKKQFAEVPRAANNFVNETNLSTKVIQILSKQLLVNNWMIETRFLHQETKANGFFKSEFDRLDRLDRISPMLIGKLNKANIIVGYDGQKTLFTFENFRMNSNVSALQNNFYSQINIPLSQFEFTIGIRDAVQTNHVDSVHSKNEALVTEQGISYQLNERARIFIRRDGNFRFPKANEETKIATNVSHLKAQTGISYEGGGEFTFDRSKTKFIIYRLNLYNEIEYNPLETPLQPFGSFSNLDPTRRDGFTVIESFDLTSKINLNAQFNFVNAKFLSGPFASKQVPAVPKINGNIGLRAKINDFWELTINSLYTGSRYPSSDLENVSEKLPGYWLNDVTFLYFYKQMLMTFEILNLFNQKYSAYTAFDNRSGENTYYPGAGRSFLITLKVDII